MSRNRYYYYDHDACTFVEVTPSRSRLVAQGTALLIGALVLAGAMTWGLDRAAHTPEEMALREENGVLQQQLTELDERLDTFQDQLGDLAVTDQELYRTLLAADPISPAERKAGIGGADPYARFDGFSGSSSRLLRETTQQLDEIERQLAVQHRSYRELEELASERETWMAQMPIIQPIGGPVVSGHGVRMHPILRVRKMHHGLDFLAPIGTPVATTGDGVVQKVVRGGGYGLHLEVHHPETGYTTLYAHLSEVADGIRQGVRVERGQTIALSGNSGRSTGPHLHYEVRDAEDRSLNPVLFLAPSMTPQAYQRLLAEAEQANGTLDY